MKNEARAPTSATQKTDAMSLSALTLRGVIGGIFMGLANLVPGISGGTMLLATGVYPAFIASIAELTTLQFNRRTLVLLGAIAGSAALAILFFAGLMRGLVIEQRWVMYSLFIGMTLGGVPLVWRLARPATPALFISGGLAFAAMVVMALGFDAGADGQASLTLLFLSGVAGASAMILPGVSGGYLLLLLGQYEPILGAIDTLKSGLLGSNGGGFDLSLVLESMWIVVPVGIGVVVGIVGVSNLLKWLLAQHEKATLGILLGLLLGAVVGLWPFQEPIPPSVGDTIKGRVVTAEKLADIDVEDWSLEYFSPSAGHLAGSLALIGIGLGCTLLIDRVGNQEKEA